MSLTTPPSVQKLQTALHAKAKESPNFRFHALYDKVYRKDVLAYAYERCEANGGAAGADNQTFEDIERYGSFPALNNGPGPSLVLSLSAYDGKIQKPEPLLPG